MEPSFFFSSILPEYKKVKRVLYKNAYKRRLKPTNHLPFYEKKRERLYYRMHKRHILKLRRKWLKKTKPFRHY
jgi:hypothetical protein